MHAVAGQRFHLRIMHLAIVQNEYSTIDARFEVRYADGFYVYYRDLQVECTCFLSTYGVSKEHFVSHREFLRVQTPFH